jgi:hypothetical protein
MIGKYDPNYFMKSKSKFILKILGKYDPNYFMKNKSKLIQEFFSKLLETIS